MVGVGAGSGTVTGGIVADAAGTARGTAIGVGEIAIGVACVDAARGTVIDVGPVSGILIAFLGVIETRTCGAGARRGAEGGALARRYDRVDPPFHRGLGPDPARALGSPTHSACLYLLHGHRHAVGPMKGRSKHQLLASPPTYNG